MLATLVRYLLLWVSRTAGAIVRRLRNKVVLNLVLIAAIAAVLRGAERVWFGWMTPGIGDAAAATAGESWLTVWNLLSVWAFGVLSWWVARARRQLVVDRVLEDASTVTSESWDALARAMDCLVRRLDDAEAFVRAARERTKIRVPVSPTTSGSCGVISGRRIAFRAANCGYRRPRRRAWRLVCGTPRR